jgi:superfamily II DNA/RNA helicase
LLLKQFSAIYFVYFKGTGKTLAFGIPILNDIMQNRQEGEEYVRALIITPTRELALQIQNHLDFVNQNSQAKVKVAKYSTLDCQRGWRTFEAKTN